MAKAGKTSGKKAAKTAKGGPASMTEDRRERALDAALPIDGDMIQHFISKTFQ